MDTCKYFDLGVLEVAAISTKMTSSPGTGVVDAPGDGTVSGRRLGDTLTSNDGVLVEGLGVALSCLQHLKYDRWAVSFIFKSYTQYIKR